MQKYEKCLQVKLLFNEGLQYVLPRRTPVKSNTEKMAAFCPNNLIAYKKLINWFKLLYRMKLL